MLLGLLLLASCDESMDSQNRLKPLGPRADLPSWPAEGEALLPVQGTVALDDLDREEALRQPPQVSQSLLERGRERYDIYCAPCHGLTGAGDGIIVARGFPRPIPLDDSRLMKASARHLLDVIGSGYGIMYPFADRVEPRDRWAIAAYIRALQLAGSQAEKAP